jgi:PAS domain-containing protein
MHQSGDSYYRTILDAIPATIFVVDDDVRILDFNDAAETTFGLLPSAVLNRRGGEVLHCLHATDVPEGCGRGPFCKDCIIRNSVTDSLSGKRVTRRRSKVTLVTGDNRRDVELLITTSPLPPGPVPLALLILEDIAEVSRLREIIPICAKCKKIRDDHQFWQNVETYFAEYSGVDFSHGLCPECVKVLYPDMDKESSAEE